MTIDQDAETVREAIPLGLKAYEADAALDRILARIAELEGELNADADKVIGGIQESNRQQARIAELEEGLQRIVTAWDEALAGEHWEPTMAEHDAVAVARSLLGDAERVASAEPMPIRPNRTIPSI